MKLINYQVVYDVDEVKYPYTARDMDGRLYGFKNIPVRDFVFNEWVDSTDGSTGELIIHERWDMSMRETAEQADKRKCNERKGKKLPTQVQRINKRGSKNVK